MFYDREDFFDAFSLVQFRVYLFITETNLKFCKYDICYDVRREYLIKFLKFKLQLAFILTD